MEIVGHTCNGCQIISNLYVDQKITFTSRCYLPNAHVHMCRQKPNAGAHPCLYRHFQTNPTDRMSNRKAFTFSECERIPMGRVVNILYLLLSLFSDVQSEPLSLYDYLVCPSQSLHHDLDLVLNLVCHRIMNLPPPHPDRRRNQRRVGSKRPRV